MHMKTIRNFFGAAAAAALLATAGCSDGTSDNDFDKLFEGVRKRHDTAILLVTFGSTYDEPHETYDRQIAQFAGRWPEADIHFSFTSKTCINNWQAKSGEQFITPDLWMQWYRRQGYEKVYVQSLHVIPGEEFTLLRDYYFKNFKWDCERDGAEVTLSLGNALLTEREDIETVGTILVDTYAEALGAGDIVAFMGHGNPEGQYDFANQSYRDLERFMKEYALKKYGSDKVFVGTVDSEDMLIDKVLPKIEAADPAHTRRVRLHPLMSIAGDHANNDMADAADPESWYSRIKAAGWTQIDCAIKGLGDYPAVNDVWIGHLETAIANPEE